MVSSDLDEFVSMLMWIYPRTFQKLASTLKSSQRLFRDIRAFLIRVYTS